MGLASSQGHAVEALLWSVLQVLAASWGVVLYEYTSHAFAQRNMAMT